ncbi:MAG: TrkA family potassium uptake protein [bacterium]|nr:TrkA family potassium uptake protein [bacterium]
MIKVAVIGLGSFGTNLVKALSEKDDIEIIAIDTDKTKVNEIKDLVAQPIRMDATNKENLTSICIGDVDYVIVSSGPMLEPSILTVHILKELGVTNIIAKALSEDHEKILRVIGATQIIFPERDDAEKLANHIQTPNLIDYIPLKSGFVIQEFTTPPAFAGKTLAEINIRKKYKVTVLGIKSNSPKKLTINPDADVLVNEKDILIVFGKTANIRRLHKKTG